MNESFKTIHLKKTNYKIKKKNLYNIVYNNKNINVIHDLKQIKLDINRNPGYLVISKNNSFEKINLKEIKLNDIIYYFFNNENKLYNILNFIPQQIYIIIYKLIYKKYDRKNFVITNFDHRTFIYDKYIIKKIDLNIININKDGVINDRDMDIMFHYDIISFYNSDFILIKENYFV